MAIGAGDVIPPVLAAPEVVMFFASGMASQAGLGDLFWGFPFERPDLCFVSAGVHVSLAWRSDFQPAC
jgi:hypothetical protein